MTNVCNYASMHCTRTYSSDILMQIIWRWYAQALIADSGGPMFRGFVEDALSTVLKLLLSVQATSLEVMSCLGRVLSALITTVGPELQMDGKDIDASESFKQYFS